MGKVAEWRGDRRGRLRRDITSEEAELQRCHQVKSEKVVNGAQQPSPESERSRQAGRQASRADPAAIIISIKKNNNLYGREETDEISEQIHFAPRP